MIAKKDLEVGAYYEGDCRNAQIARWDGEVFYHWRTKFTMRFLECIKHPEDDDVWDVFIPERKIEPQEEIPWDAMK